MDTVTLKQTSLDVSRICFGTMTFGGQTDLEAARGMIDLCVEAGINFLDTANVYNSGASEEMLGRLLEGRRKDFILASKVRNKMGDGVDMAGLSLDAMNELVQQGKVRYLASSNYSGWQTVEMLWIAQRKGEQAPYVAQPMYNLIARGIEQEYLPMSKRFGISNVVYNPLAGGLLTGKQRRDAPLPGSRFDNNRMYLDRYWHQADFDAVDQLQRIAAAAGRSLVSLALNWIYHHTRVECIILGASRVDHLEQNLKVLSDGPLDPETLQGCDKVWEALRGPTPKYNR